MTFPAVIAVVVLAGIGLVFAADRDQANADDTPPQAGIHHWHVAFGIYDCDHYLPDITDQNDPVGIHSHADGVIHIHPFLSKASGKNARLDDFFDAVDLDVSDNRVKLPEGQGGTELRDGDDCGGQPGELRMLVWDSPDDEEPEVRTSDFGKERFTTDGAVMALVRAPADAEIPKPDSTVKLSDLSLLDDVYPEEPNPGTTTTVAGEGEGEGEGEGDGGATDTTAPGTDTTAAPTDTTEATTDTTAAPDTSAAPSTSAP